MAAGCSRTKLGEDKMAMNPQITINISICPEGVRVSGGTREVSGEEFAVPPVPAAFDTGESAEAGETVFAPPSAAEEDLSVDIDEEIFAPPELEEETEMQEEDLEIPPLPEEDT